MNNLLFLALISLLLIAPLNVFAGNNTTKPTTEPDLLARMMREGQMMNASNPAPQNYSQCVAKYNAEINMSGVMPTSCTPPPKVYDMKFNFTAVNAHTGENVSLPIAPNTFNFTDLKPLTTLQNKPCEWDGVLLGEDTLIANRHLEAIQNGAMFDSDAAEMKAIANDTNAPLLYWCGSLP